MFNKIKKSIINFANRNTFFPTILGVFTNPFWLCRRALYLALSELAPNLSGTVLDFGCGSGPYRSLLVNCDTYMGLEYDTPENRLHKRADVFYDGHTIPLSDASVQGLLSTQTIEHVPNPQDIIREWARVMASNGTLLMTVPFMWPEHEMPYDFQRYTTNGLRKLLEEAGFEVLEQRKLLNDCRAPAQLFLAWLYDSAGFGQRSFKVQLVLTACLFAPIAILATFLARVCPKTSNTYLDNIILAKRL